MIYIRGEPDELETTEETAAETEPAILSESIGKMSVSIHNNVDIVELDDILTDSEPLDSLSDKGIQMRNLNLLIFFLLTVDAVQIDRTTAKVQSSKSETEMDHTPELLAEC